MHTFLGKHAYRLEIFRVLHKDDNLLCSRLLDFFETTANCLGRSYECLLTYVTRGYVTCIWPCFCHSFLVCLCDGAIEEDSTLNTVVITPDFLTMPLNNRKFAFKPSYI